MDRPPRDARRALVVLVALGAVVPSACGAPPPPDPEHALDHAIGIAREDLSRFRGHEAVLHATSLEDPSGHALDHARAAFERAARGDGAAHVIVYGGSHTAADLYTGMMRHGLQAGFGDLGHGFVMPVPPFEHYWQDGVRVFPSEGFASVEPSLKHMEPDTYGIAGMAFDAEGPATAELETDHTRASRMELSFLAQPGGGTLRVHLDGAPFDVPTAAPERSAATVTFAATDGPHHLTLEALGDGPVRLYGVTFDREGPGVVLDQLGLAGAKARHQLLWDEPTWSALLVARHPDLVVVSYGNNETDDHHLSDAEHVAHFEQMLSRLRAHVPDASCVVVGPSDRMLPDGSGAIRTPPLLEVLRGAQRESAARHGCAFFDVMGWQGGPGAMGRWARLDPPLAREDAIHFSELGYRRLGAALTDALLDALAQPPASSPPSPP